MSADPSRFTLHSSHHAVALESLLDYVSALHEHKEHQASDLAFIKNEIQRRTTFQPTNDKTNYQDILGARMQLVQKASDEYDNGVVLYMETLARCKKPKKVVAIPSQHA
jgi:hypothetical protein